ncbi:alpha-2-macroglobulin-like protein 1 [Plakobranchus ocellatus]|uniref:Alpha-2-macroglobulin-like protein 1 n=1 Tax=Plakobranchus ocellatus TaxID=259542 RepID=A0AAV3XF78_9GAST|nr:alpha-2-macroglobulin-like protein 1 [Plakobranchus ocellatus]
MNWTEDTEAEPETQGLDWRQRGSTRDTGASLEKTCQTREMEIPEYLDYGTRPKIRPYYIEPWFWRLVDVGTGEEMLNLKVMKYITTWSAQALCVSKTKGFGMSEVVSHTVFKPLTISVKQPYAAVLDERLPVFISIRSSLDYCVWGMVHMVWNSKFLNADGYYGPRRIGCICGDKPYNVWALNELCGERARTGRDISYGNASISDEVHRKILVKAEGVEQSYTYTSYFCSEGDIMGAPLSNLEYLVHMPTNCGEQNMIGFVSNILVLNYLNSTGNLEETARQTALNKMKKGYQEALSFRHKDGSFSAFGDKDPKGSVWLTSFLIKSFARAQKISHVISWYLMLSHDISCNLRISHVISRYLVLFVKE